MRTHVDVFFSLGPSIFIQRENIQTIPTKSSGDIKSSLYLAAFTEFTDNNNLIFSLKHLK